MSSLVEHRPDGAFRNSRPVFRTKDPDRIGEYMSGVFRPNRSAMVNGASSADFCHRKVDFASSSINLVRYGRKAVVEAPPINDTYLCVITVDGSAEVTQGRDAFAARSGSLFILNPTQSLRAELSSDFEQLTLKLPAVLLNRVLAESAGRSRPRPVEFASSSFRLQGRVASMWNLISAASHDMLRKDSAFVVPEISASLERTLAQMLLSVFPHNYSPHLQQKPESAAPCYIRKAEEFIHENARGVIALADIALACNISERSLQAGFRKFRNTSPMAYLRNCRLSLAREQIEAGAEDMTQITDIALDCGFTHLSKFSRHYFQRFGELPSQTLRRGQGLACWR
ncbi:AraC family transcriptional regulator [Kineobactrum salinum]|uniref:AraC family transcriptional regulator n=1 Tax=Kineobactrum salinum TaxID=2708301 RepID=A0A6C0UAF2_9GAMM|nr:AraC family transcriptional regulator [Kineobactrum salinum]QIB66804.1 AraC family transcriptional regulator [Kineobactrum salinum]